MMADACSYQLTEHMLETSPVPTEDTHLFVPLSQKASYLGADRTAE